MNHASASALRRAACAVVAVAGLAVWAVPGSAQTLNPSPQQVLNYAKQMYGAYKAQSNASGYNATVAQLNSQAQSDPACAAISTAGINAAQQFVKTAMPPNPTSMIQGSTCFLDIMAIKIPTTGIGFIDGLIASVVKFAMDKACALTNNFWADMMAKVNLGNFQVLLSGNPLSFMKSGALQAPAGLSGYAAPAAMAPATVNAVPVAQTPPAPTGPVSAGPAKSGDLQVFGGLSAGAAGASPSAVDTFVKLLSR